MRNLYATENTHPHQYFNTIITPNPPNTELNNIMRLMQQQLEISNKIYQDKIKELLRNNSIQLSTLQNQITINNQILISKEQEINQLKQKINSIKLKQNSNEKKIDIDHNKNHQQVLLIQDDHIKNRIKDSQTKISIIINQIFNKSLSFSQQIQFIQNNLIKYFAHRLKKIEKNIDQYIISNNNKLISIQNNITNMVNRQIAMNKVSDKNIQTSEMANIKLSIERVQKNLESLKKDTNQFMKKEFKYENYNIDKLQKCINKLSNQIKYLQQKQLQSQKSTKDVSIKQISQISNSQLLIKPKLDKRKSIFQNTHLYQNQQLNNNTLKKTASKNQRPRLISQNSNISASKFQDYDENNNYSMISGGQDYFFYTQHNDSFEKFTSQQQEDELSNNEYRLIQTLKWMKEKLPLIIQVDRTGCIRKKGSKQYIKDKDNNFFSLGKIQLLRLRQKRVIQY